MKHFSVSIFHSQEDGGYIADIPDLAICSAFGSTRAGALAQLVVAREAWVETARAEGRPIPEPRHEPEEGDADS